MRRIAVYVAVVCMLLLALPVATQEEEGNIAMVVTIKAKDGMRQQYEEGVKRHGEWHRQQNDPWTWEVWEFISGENTGAYGAGTFGHRWEEFDTAPVSREADSADVQKNIAPFQKSVIVQFYAYLAKVSRPEEGEGLAPMSAGIEFQVRQGKNEEFNHLVGKFHKAIEKTNWPVHYKWYALVNGGAGGTYVLVLPRENWASFAQPEKLFPAMLEEAYGRQEAESLLERWSKAVKGTRSSISRTRPDLSYFPSGQ